MELVELNGEESICLASPRKFQFILSTCWVICSIFTVYGSNAGVCREFVLVWWIISQRSNVMTSMCQDMCARQIYCLWWQARKPFPAIKILRSSYISCVCRHRPWDMVLVLYGFPTKVHPFFIYDSGPTNLWCTTALLLAWICCF